MQVKKLLLTMTVVSFICACAPVASDFRGRVVKANAHWSEKYEILNAAYKGNLISGEQYWIAYWNLCDEFADIGQFFEFHEYAAFGRLQTERLKSGTIDGAEFHYLITKKGNETVQQVKTNIQTQIDREAAERTQKAFLLGTFVGTLVNPPSQSTSTCSGTVSGNVFSGTCR